MSFLLSAHSPQPGSDTTQTPGRPEKKNCNALLSLGKLSLLVNSITGPHNILNKYLVTDFTSSPQKELMDLPIFFLFFSFISLEDREMKKSLSENIKNAF